MPDQLDIERPPHFRLSPEQRTRTEGEPYPPSDYPGVEEGAKPYADIAEPEPLQVDTGITPEPIHENLDWSGSRVHVGNTRMVQIAGRLPNRRRLYLRNLTDGVDVYLGRNQTDSLFAMFVLGGSAPPELDMFHQGEVWAICAGSDEADLSIIQEFVPRED